MSKQQRSKFWAFIVYPESCDLNRFIEDMTNYRVPYAISPLHDKDLDKDGNIKKAHYHIILAYDNPLSFNTVADFTKQYGTIPIKLQSVEEYYNYFDHSEVAGHDGKALYKKDDIIRCNGFDLRNYCKISKAKQSNITKELSQFIFDNKIFEYSDFITYAIGMGADYFDIAVSRTLYFNHLITSLRHSLHKK